MFSDSLNPQEILFSESDWIVFKHALKKRISCRKLCKYGRAWAKRILMIKDVHEESEAEWGR